MIPPSRIAQLAELYDRYNNAFDPLSAGCNRARREFDELVASLHTAHAADVDFRQFRYELVQRCREYLRKNPSQ